jgi:hypothetical protein
MRLAQWSNIVDRIHLDEGSNHCLQGAKNYKRLFATSLYAIGGAYQIIVTLSRALSPKDGLYSGFWKMDTVKAVTDMCDGKQSLALGNSRLRLGHISNIVIVA